MSILEEIFAHKRTEVEKSRLELSLDAIQELADKATPARDFLSALRNGRGPGGLPSLIAEVKHRSPSAGILLADFDPLRLARIYQQNGAAAISVLTDEHYFGGSLDILQRISELGLDVPLLRKDFIFDPYQVYEARMFGADAILLIAAELSAKRLNDLHRLASDLGMTPLIEVHNIEELRQALDCKPRLIGINNRNLHDFSVHLDVSLQLRPRIPEDVLVVSELGIRSRSDLLRLADAGVDAVLIGEALVTSPDVAAAVRDFCGERETQ